MDGQRGTWRGCVYLHCLWQKYLIYCWTPIMGRKCCVPNCKSGYKSQVKIKKNASKHLGKNREKRSTKLENGIWNQNPLCAVNISNVDIWNLELLSLKFCCSGLNMHILVNWTLILCTTLLVLISKMYKKQLLVLSVMIFLEKTLPYKSILKVWSKKIVGFFVDEINRGGLVKPSVLVYAMCTFAWDTYSQIMRKCLPQWKSNWKH